MRFSQLALAAALTLSGLTASAQVAAPFKTAVEKALQTNPDVTARLHAYLAARDATDIARAAYRPRLDLNAEIANDTSRITSSNPPSQSLYRDGVSVSLTQLLWDGMGTRRDIQRADHDTLTRYFELMDTTEQTALEAARTYYDVQRYRRLVTLAEDNYVQHKYATLQIQSRFKAGVGRGVDLEQANARLALAESNLTTELSNLHDVTARYERVVGEPPPRALPAVAPLEQGLPATSDAAISEALRDNAAISASIEALRATRSSVDVRRSAFQPRVEARVRAGAGDNFDAIRDQRRDTTAQIVLNWNLYNGGADQARVRQQVQALNQAADLRDKTCRDTRQTAAIAFNDTRKLAEQVELLDRNTLAIEKARDAYRQQFDIGQRSLLDLLNAENELYTARRAYANAQFDLDVAFLRAQASMNRLTTRLGIARLDPAAVDAAAGWAAGDDAPGRCPVMTAQIESVDRAALDKRAHELVEQASPGSKR